jgi:hypothetical protein
MDKQKVIVLSPFGFLHELRGRFPDYEFKEVDSMENIEEEGPALIAMEAAKGLEAPVVVEDWDDVGLCGVHSGESEIPVTLKMLVKIGAVRSAVLIRIPADYHQERALDEASEILSGLLGG